MTELARAGRGPRTSRPSRSTQAHLDRIAALDGKLRSYITVTGDAALAAAQGGGGRGDGRGTARTAPRRADRAQGPLLHEGRQDHRRLADPRRLGARRRTRRWSSRLDRGRRHRARQAQHARVRVRAGGAQPALRHAVEPVGRQHPPDLRRARRRARARRWPPASARARSAPTRAAPSASRPSLCGISGIKPTYGRVSRAGVLPLAWSLDHVGPMCRTAADCALMLGAMAGYDPRDPTTSVLPVPDYMAALTGAVKGLRVGMLRVLLHGVGGYRRSGRRSSRRSKTLAGLAPPSRTSTSRR